MVVEEIGELELQEWFEAGLEPLHFQILSKKEITEDHITTLEYLINNL